ncbi:AAA family ATPase [Mammaliicoccus sciuri]|uniref:AAA family ATPase n=1 Tax=Mammaliicoccus sciuri TaxID=1296 RepID=UPI000E68552F|nr:AAA family ATPase [Mammaliicoccus sciuri]MDT0755369.1 AAA family ATPase [Mammaliicoccus sciuri]RIN83268.1 ATP-binding protein [Mammaliicoccus sciuri]
MATPGIGDPYWYEWYVGIEQIIKMLNPDNKITYIIFQSDIHNTIDDVVVGYDGIEEICYQVKHEVGNQGKGNLTFSKIIEKTPTRSGNEKVSLIRALALGWKEAKDLEGKSIVPILYTNRKLGSNRTTRIFNENEYNALPLGSFLNEVLPYLKQIGTIEGLESCCDEEDLLQQWREFKEAIGDDSIAIEFLKNLQIKANERSLEELEESMIHLLENTFKCNRTIATNLFEKLCSNIRIWATTRRPNAKVTVEDVLDVLALNSDVEYGNHELPYPMPFFESRENYAQEIISIIREEEKKVIWISGNPGSGKTSLISYLQLKHELFTARYHTFKPISPEQKYYNSDSGLCRPESLWNDLLIQLRKKFKGEFNKYQIPVINALCTVEQMRSEVMRLSKILYEKTGTKTVICIDGIDHAARANNEITFLDSLYRPDEILDGVMFIIVGQPAQFYENYPLWIRKETEFVKHCLVPNLGQDDIEKLLEKSKIDFDINIKILASFIHEKTQGNNLSVVFAVEEAKKCRNIDEYKTILDTKHVSENITNYYSYIWKYVSDYLNKKSLGILFPDRLLASIIILLNGRLNSEILSKAIKVNLMKEDWDELLDLLYPLIQKTSNNEYVLFHNDFRVFLSANNNEGEKFKATALQLAEYYMSKELNPDSLLNIIPLLVSAERKDLITKAFDSDYVIYSLAYGMSKKNLEEQAVLAYQASIESRDWHKFHSVYLAVSTLHQHHRYFEYYDKNYHLLDKSYVKVLSPFELRTAKTNEHNIETYRNMFLFCKDLLSLKDPISKSRAENTFNLWTENLTPDKFVSILTGEGMGIYDNNMLEQIVEMWGTIAAQLGKEYLEINQKIELDLLTDEQIKAMAMFNDNYFKYYLKQFNSDKALEVVSNGGVTLSCIENNIVDILLSNQTGVYSELLQNLIKGRELTNDILLTYVSLIFDEQDVPIIDISNMDKITYITDETNLKVVLLSIIAGYQLVNSDISIGLVKINELIDGIERKNREYEYLKILIRHGFLIGRVIREGNLEVTSTINQNLFIKSYEDFLEYKNRFNSLSSFKILLFISLNQSKLLYKIDIRTLMTILEKHLLESNKIGMFYKSIILDFMVKNNNMDCVKAYILKLYGENGENLFREGDFKEIHQNFGEYVNITFPDLYTNINNKLKWDVIGYIDHKEYALWTLLQHFKKISEFDSKEWKNRGIKLSQLSTIIDNKGDNRVSFEIQKEISLAAAKSGIKDIWELRQIDEEFYFSLDLLYEQLFRLIENLNDEEELKAMWILCCGILSWYRKDDQIGINRIYNSIVKRAKEIHFEEIEYLLNDISPEHTKIALNYELKSNDSYNESNYKIKIDNKEIRDFFYNLETGEIIEFLKVEEQSFASWLSLDIAWDIIFSRNEITPGIAEQFKSIIFNKLETYSWESSGCINIVKKTFNILNEDFLWELATYNLRNIDDGDSFYAFKSNMNFILQLAGECSNLDFIKYMFDEELKCQSKWLSGCDHINISYEFVSIESDLRSPINIKEFVLNILMEQILTRNIHRIEIAILGIEMLTKYFPEVFSYMSSSWELYNVDQKECLIKLSERWSEENKEGFNNLYLSLVKEYLNTNELDKKIQLYFLIKTYNRKNSLTHEEINYSAETFMYSLDESYPKLFSKTKISIQASRFLDLMENLNGINNDDLRYYIQQNKVLGNNKKRNNIARNGDSMLFPASYTELDMKILYGEEQKYRWSNIPIGCKAQVLLNMDDAYVITKMPKVDFDSKWEIENELKTYFKNRTLLKCKPLLKRILYKDIPDDMIVLGGSVWYPLGSQDEVIYYESSKVISKEVLIKNQNIKKAINTRHFIAKFFEPDEYMFEIEEENINETGVSMVNEIIGTSIFMYGSTMTYPSKVITEVMGLEPCENNSLRWKDKSGNEVVYFERHTNPNREAIHERYYRQPLMTRWLCKKTIIEKLIQTRDLSFYNVNRIESMEDRLE